MPDAPTRECPLYTLELKRAVEASADNIHRTFLGHCVRRAQKNPSEQSVTRDVLVQEDICIACCDEMAYLVRALDVWTTE